MAQRRLTKATEITESSANPHNPEQRGVIEYTNGVLRQGRPTGSDLSGFTQEGREAMTWTLNTRPRMSLGFEVSRRGLPRTHSISDRILLRVLYVVSEPSLLNSANARTTVMLRPGLERTKTRFL